MPSPLFTSEELPHIGIFAQGARCTAQRGGWDAILGSREPHHPVTMPGFASALCPAQWNTSDRCDCDGCYYYKEVASSI